MNSLRWRAYPPTRIKSLRRIVAPSHSRSVALSLRCEVAPSQSSAGWDPGPRGTLGGPWDPGAPSAPLGPWAPIIPKLFRVDGYSEWMAIPRGWLFRVDGIPSGWLFRADGYQQKTFSVVPRWLPQSCLVQPDTPKEAYLRPNWPR